MLTLTGNTISMDVFGPVADNANGIGEMGYDKKEMGEEKYNKARQILADLDAVGNTTKAETKGIAIGSAVIAAVSLFASFIAVIAVRALRAHGGPEDVRSDSEAEEEPAQVAAADACFAEALELTDPPFLLRVDVDDAGVRPSTRPRPITKFAGMNAVSPPSGP